MKKTEVKKYEALEDFEFSLCGEELEAFYEGEIYDTQDLEEFNISYLLEKGYVQEIKKPRNNKFIPRFRERYYYVNNASLEVFDEINTKASFDLNHIRVGNCYKTKEEAQKALDRLILLVEIREFADEYNGDWVPDWAPDWRNTGQLKYHLAYNGHNEEFDWESTLWYTQSVVYFKDPNFVKPLIEKFGDRLELLKPEDI